jgi:tetratricopeptide (TPR) repeat protein
MRLPEDIVAKLKSGAHLGIKFSEQGYAEGFSDPPSYCSGVLYPPLGYLEWRILEVGNGDTYGYYWPIGKENNDPIVCTTMHDEWTLWPVATNLEKCLRVLLVREPYLADEILAVANDFGYDVSDIQILDGPVGHEWPDALPQDPDSPALLLDRARRVLHEENLGEAQGLLAHALDVLPEYTEASFLLARICRRQRDLEATRAALLAVLTSPDSLCARVEPTREKALAWFQALRGGDLSGGDGVLWRERRRLTAGYSRMSPNEYAIYEEAIAAYHAAGQGTTAVRVRVLIGEILYRQGATFAWIPEAHARKLRADIEKAGLDLRARALSV